MPRKLIKSTVLSSWVVNTHENEKGYAPKAESLTSPKPAAAKCRPTESNAGTVGESKATFRVPGCQCVKQNKDQAGASRERLTFSGKSLAFVVQMNSFGFRLTRPLSCQARRVCLVPGGLGRWFARS